MGLVTPEIIPTIDAGARPGVMEYVSRRRAPSIASSSRRGSPGSRRAGETLEPIYRACASERNEVAGAAEMVVYRLLRCAV